MRRAEAEQRALERAGRQQFSRPTEPDPAKARTLFGDHMTTKWWPAWKDQHPSSEYGTRKKVEKRILPLFGDIRLGELDPSTIGTWKAAMVAEGLRPRTVNTYPSLLGTILNDAAVDHYLARSPLMRKSGAGRTAATRNQPVPPRRLARPGGDAGKQQLRPGLEAGPGQGRAGPPLAEYGGLHFHDLRHPHATCLIAQRVPMIAVAGRLGHANAVVTMMIYAHVDKLVDRGLLTAGELGLASPAPAPAVELAPRVG
jgi:hypothetical protein